MVFLILFDFITGQLKIAFYLISGRKL